MGSNGDGDGLDIGGEEANPRWCCKVYSWMCGM